MAQRGRVRIGISGWTYAAWRGEFYPKGLARKRELAYASGIFRTIEVNGTFYGQQRPESFARWAAETPEGFVFSVKAPRFITHVRRLRDVRAPLANFIASGLLRLGAKLGPILWQFPPSFRFDAALCEAFLKLLPHDGEAAVRLARSHDDRLRGKGWFEAAVPLHVRHAVEIRNESFAVPEFIELLAAHDVALVCADAAAWPRLMDLTADFVYCRLHGSEELYASGYDETLLAAWAARAKAWALGGEPRDAERERAARRKARDVFIYFDNDAKLHAPRDAQRLDVLVDRLMAPRRAAGAQAVVA